MVETQDIINGLFKSLQEHSNANTVVVSTNKATEEVREQIKFNLETALSGLCCRPIHVVFEKPTEDYPELSFHVAYFAENDTNDKKLTLEEVFNK